MTSLSIDDSASGISNRSARSARTALTIAVSRCRSFFVTVSSRKPRGQQACQHCEVPPMAATTREIEHAEP